MLHLEIITERLEREFDINLLTTTPGVVYKVHLNDGKIISLQNPTSLPDPTLIKFIEEPWIKANLSLERKKPTIKETYCKRNLLHKFCVRRHSTMETPEASPVLQLALLP